MEIIQSGQKKTDVLNGKVRIEDGNQRLIAENADGTTIILGKNNQGDYGITYYDIDQKIISIATGDGTTYYQDGLAKIRIGTAPNEAMGFWIAAAGEDVIDLLS